MTDTDPYSGLTACGGTFDATPTVADTDPAATLHALADLLRSRPHDSQQAADEDDQWAEHVEGVAQRHRRRWTGAFIQCTRCNDSTTWPCTEVRGLLAVAAAAGVTP